MQVSRKHELRTDVNGIELTRKQNNHNYHILGSSCVRILTQAIRSKRCDDQCYFTDQETEAREGFVGGVIAAKMDRKQLPSRCPLGTVSNDLRILQGNSSLELSEYWDWQFDGDNDDQEKLLKESSTLYVGNLSFHTTEEQIYELFSRCGAIKHVFMGLDKIKKKACGFCFVEYYNRVDAENAMWFLKGPA
ncbi:hypothetical protein GH733_019321 [Mirounga leonina]|nr:hypothetical protein GH733_019321 [Mirounga leonina]